MLAVAVMDVVAVAGGGGGGGKWWWCRWQVMASGASNFWYTDRWL